MFMTFTETINGGELYDKKKLLNSLTQKVYLSFKDVGASIDVIVVDLDKYEHLKTDPYLIYLEADKNGRMVYEKS
jgi:hypothetical protein